jgi:AcrR family transcriptional regulator
LTRIPVPEIRRVPTSQFSTKQRILEAAETLFARHGFAGASLRQVTSAANVNLAAVNYHFGSKDKLIEEVFRRRLDELNSRRLKALQALEENASLEDALAAFIRPALDLAHEGEGGGAFVRVLARAYAEHNDQLRKFLSENYGHVLKQFAKVFSQQLPDLDREELYWRLDIVAGALTYAMADFGIIQRRAEVSERQHREQAIQHLIRFAAAGLRAS